MGTTLSSIIEALNHPPQKHAVMIHLPIVIGMLGLLALAVFAWTRGTSKAMQRCCLFLYGLGALAAWRAEEAGEAALTHLDVSVLSEQALEVIELHEEMGERVCVMLAAVFVLLLGTYAKVKGIRITCLTLAMALGAIAACYITATAHHGGTLVYTHGVGTP